MENNNFEINNDNERAWKGTHFWEEEIRKAGIFKELRFFNDVIVERKPPHSESGYREPILVDVVLDDKKCDIYHTDHDKADTYSRVFIHIKE